jgi:hypothetical protein
MRVLLHLSLSLQDFYAALDTAIGGRQGPVLLYGDGTDQNVGRSALDAATSAKVGQTRGLFAVKCCELFIRIGFESSPQLVELSQFFNAGQNFLTDGADDDYLTVLDRICERCAHQFLIDAQPGLRSTAQ